MLLWLADFLAQYFTVFGVVKYLTFRAILGMLTALGISLVFGPKMISQAQLFANWSVYSHRWSRESFEQVGYADYGWRINFIVHFYQYITLVRPIKLLRLGCLAGDLCIWRRGLG